MRGRRCSAGSTRSVATRRQSQPDASQLQVEAVEQQEDVCAQIRVGLQRYSSHTTPPPQEAMVFARVSPGAQPVAPVQALHAPTCSSQDEEQVLMAVCVPALQLPQLREISCGSAFGSQSP